MVPFGVPIIVRHLYLGYPKRDHNFDNPTCVGDEAVKVLRFRVQGCIWVRWVLVKSSRGFEF